MPGEEQEKRNPLPLLPPQKKTNWAVGKLSENLLLVEKKSLSMSAKFGAKNSHLLKIKILHIYKICYREFAEFRILSELCSVRW